MLYGLLNQLVTVTLSLVNLAITISMALSLVHGARHLYSSHPSPHGLQIMACSPLLDKVACGDATGRLQILGDYLDGARVEYDLAVTQGEPITNMLWIRLPLSSPELEIGYGGLIVADATGCIHTVRA